MLIETVRLVIRPFQADDWANALEYLTDPVVMHYIPLGVMDKNQVIDFVSEEPNEKSECFAIELKSDKKVIGQVIYHPWFAKDTFEIGWIIHPGYQKKGYATEASKAVIRYGFIEQKLHRIIATCQPDNPSSWKVAEKIGMHREGFFRQSIYTEHGIWWDEYFYAILVNDWSQND
ncbi:MAG: GNAT family N-acetyltransferase [Caldisericia bacterium]|nr:GNAT family N-acetyltransferase [Caldisericia bacterium]